MKKDQKKDVWGRNKAFLCSSISNPDHQSSTEIIENLKWYLALHPELNSLEKTYLLLIGLSAVFSQD